MISVKEALSIRNFLLTKLSYGRIHIDWVEHNFCGQYRDTTVNHRVGVPMILGGLVALFEDRSSYWTSGLFFRRSSNGISKILVSFCNSRELDRNSTADLRTGTF